MCVYWLCQHFDATIKNLQIVIDILEKQPPQLFYKKGVLKNLAKFTGKHLRQSLFFNKVAGLLQGFCSYL